MQSDIVASCVTVAARLSASVTHWHTVTLPFCRNRRNSTDGRWVQPSGLQGCNLRCFQGLVTLLPIPPCSSLWLSFFLPSLRPAYLTYFLLSSLVHDQGRKERQGWAVDQQSAYFSVVDSGFLHASFCSFYDWTVRTSCMYPLQLLINTNASGQLSQRRAADAVEIKPCCYCHRWR